MNDAPDLSSSAQGLSAHIDALFSEFDVRRAKELDRAIRRRCQTEPSRQDLDFLHRLCLLYAHFSQPVEGFAVASAAVRAARKLGDRETLRRALTARAALRRMAGDINGAIQDNVEVYDMVKDDPTMIAAPMSNLVFALGLMDLDDLALRLADYAMSLMPQKPSTIAQWAAWSALTINACDLLVGKDPRRVLRLSRDVEQQVHEHNKSDLSLEDRLVVATRHAASLLNQVIASLNLGDRELAASAVAKLRTLITEVNIPRMQHGARVAIAAYEARYGDEVEGLRQLRSLSDAGTDEYAVDASRRLVEFYEAHDRPDEAGRVLRGLQARLQSIRRNVGLEELDRLDPIDDAEKLQEVEAETERQLLRYSSSGIQVAGLLASKLDRLESIAVTAELREGTEMNRAYHAHRVGRLSFFLATEHGCPEDVCALAEIAGRLHDIGKCAVPDATILSPTPLTLSMREDVREHADYGARLIADADEPSLVRVVAAVRHHHERFDGTGYPSNLQGDHIPLLARIVAICESFDAMMQSRVFRNSRTLAGALEEVERCAGSQFDPTLAGLFVRMVRRLQREHDDVVEYLGSDARHNSAVRTFERVERLIASTRTGL